MTLGGFKASSVALYQVPTRSLDICRLDETHLMMGQISTFMSQSDVRVVMLFCRADGKIACAKGRGKLARAFAKGTQLRVKVRTMQETRVIFENWLAFSGLI